MRHRTALFALLVGFQALVLVGTAVGEEAQHRRGDEVVLQTVPVDPRDLLRGDYVVLAYEIGIVERGGFDSGETVFVALEEDGGVWHATSLHGRRDEAGELAIGGRSTGGGSIEFGIEAYFVPEGRGWEIEQAEDVKVAVRIDDAGRARIQHLIVDGERWD